MKIAIYIISFLCLSFVAQSQICVGEPGKVKWECWRGIFDDEFSELSAIEFYPKKPNVVKTIYSINAPINYDNNFGAIISGFIHAPVSDSITFNITGNAKVQLYISSNSSPSNMTLKAYTNDYTNEFEYTKFTTQTSSKLYFTANAYYYFELRYVESTGSDHCKLFWKASFLPNNEWNIITASYLNEVGCSVAPCPVRGTTCNDSNTNTIDDQQDGHCNCIGKPVTSNNCIGERGQIERFLFDNIPGSSLNDLYLDPNFPAVPETSTKMSLFSKKTEYSSTNSGNLVQAYLTVPVTGMYKFNVTGDDNTILFISSDDNPDNKQAHQVLVSGWTYMTEHNKYIYQSTSNIYLETGKYYYIEINHKQSSGSEHFGAFWQTPFTGTGIWKRIPAFYMYDYNCDIACVPQGTPCNDGNAFTNNDLYDENCNCLGTPCSGPDCDSPLANYVPYEKCNVTDQLDNNASNNWLSCQISDNPNPLRDRSHWIKYNLGERHQLISSHIWNYNVENETDKGFQTVAIDYSDDGMNWTELGEYNWPLATGEFNYGGFMGPDFSGIFAKHLLFTSLDDTLTCRGIGKVAFKAIFCPVFNTPCDDLNPLTINDIYNQSCECKGINILENACEEMNVMLGDSMIYTNVYSAIENVNSISTINNSSTVSFIGGKSVILDVGFETLPNSIFIASIDECEPNPIAQENLLAKEISASMLDKNKLELQIIPVPNSDFVDIFYHIADPGKVKLSIKDLNNKSYTLTNHDYLNKGWFRKRIRTKRLNNGIHKVILVTSGTTFTEKLVVGTESTESKSF